MTVRRYRAQFRKRTLRISTFWTPDGKLEQFLVSPATEVGGRFRLRPGRSRR